MNTSTPLTRRASAPHRTVLRAKAGAHEPALQVRWLLRLRWAAIAAQIASLLGVKYLLRAPFPLPPLVALVALLVAANVWLARALRRDAALPPRAIALHLLLDVAVLTGLLVWTGGAMNPFTTLYLLHVALAAILLPRRWSVVVMGASVAAFGVLLLARPEAIHVWHSASMFMLHVRGMWFAFALTAGTLWFFVDRVSAALRAREAVLERAARVASLGALAAGTAHELNTPLGTVAILAAELSESLAGHPAARKQADEIRAAVRRCTEILRRMRSYDAPVDAAQRVALGEWAREAVQAWSARAGAATTRVGVDVEVAPSAEDAEARIWPELLAAALGNVLDNAERAVRQAGSSASVRVRVTRDGDALAIDVEDRGAGVAPEVLARLGEPFTTTQPPGEGMGLGIFLAEAAIGQHGGALQIDSVPGATRVRFRLPRA